MSNVRTIDATKTARSFPPAEAPTWQVGMTPDFVPGYPMRMVPCRFHRFTLRAWFGFRFRRLLPTGEPAPATLDRLDGASLMSSVLRIWTGVLCGSLVFVLAALAVARLV